MDIILYKGYDWDDYGRYLFEECGYDREIPDSLQNYFDFEEFGRDSGRYEVEEYSEGLIEIIN